jgi:hypothetical protein
MTATVPTQRSPTIQPGIWPPGTRPPDACPPGTWRAGSRAPGGHESVTAPSGVNHAARPRSAARRSVERLVLRELSRVRSAPVAVPLTPRTLLADAGIDRNRLLDAACRIEGHYQMRFRDEWLREIRSVGDLIGCVIARMFDSLDAAVDCSRTGFGHCGAA